jgi:hypothetical protein
MGGRGEAAERRRRGSPHLLHYLRRSKIVQVAKPLSDRADIVAVSLSVPLQSLSCRPATVRALAFIFLQLSKAPQELRYLADRSSPLISARVERSRDTRIANIADAFAFIPDDRRLRLSSSRSVQVSGNQVGPTRY